MGDATRFSVSGVADSRLFVESDMPAIVVNRAGSIMTSRGGTLACGVSDSGWGGGCSLENG